MRRKIFFNLFLLFLFGLAAIAIFWPILFGGKIIDDVFNVGLFGHYKFIADFGNQWRDSGSLKLWWPDYLGGFPVYLTQVGFFSPLVFIISSFFKGFPVYNWIIFFNFLLGGLAMYWFARNLSLSKIASTICGLVYVFSQNNIYWGSTLVFSNVFIFIPLFFGCLFKISKINNKWHWWLFGSLIATYGLVAGETQIVFYTFIIGFVWALFLKYKINNWKPVLGYFSISAIGAILASFWIIPVLNYLQFTTRGGSMGFADLSFDFMRIADPLRFFYPYIQLPQFTGLVSLGIVPNYYIGALTFFLAIAAIFLARKNKMVAFWTGVAAFSFLVRVKWTGIFWLLHFLPGFNRFRGAFHWAFISSFALALLAGFALDNLDKIKESRHFGKFIKALKIFGWANIAAIIVIFFAGLFRNKILNVVFQFFDAKIYQGTRKFPLEHYHGVISSEFNKFLNSFSFGNYHFVVSFAGVLIAVLIFVLYQKGKINFDNFSAQGGSASGGKKLVLIFTVLNLVLIWQGYYKFIPQSKITDYPDTVRFIKNYSSGSQFRFFSFYPPESYQAFGVFNIKDWTDYKLKTLESNNGVYFDMDGFSGAEPFLSGRSANVFDEIGNIGPTTVIGEPWLRSTKLTLDDKIKRFSSSQNQNLFSMLNIKYIFSSFKLPNFKLIYETTATEKNIPVYIYENTKVMPRIYFAKNVKFADSNSAFDELLKVKDFKELTLIECGEDCPPAQFSIFNFKFSNLKVEKFESQEIKIKTKTNQAQWLIYSDANLPTWEATIDNQPAPIYTANYLFKSVFVPEGEHEVVFKYPGLWGQNKAAFKNLIFDF